MPKKTDKNKKPRGKKTPVVADRTFKHFGRPTKYTEEIADKICELLSKGKTLIHICEDEGMPTCRTVQNWLRDESHKDFFRNYQYARELQADYWADEIIKIADDGRNDYNIDPETGEPRVDYDHIKRSQLRTQVRQWNAARRAPKKYGDKSSVEMSGPSGSPLAVQIYIPSNGREKPSDANS
jgi:hypothetical protein